MMLSAPAQAARILALSPHACEMLYAIGAEADIVGAVSYCDFPEAAKRLPRVGSYKRINVEAALLLHPDLVVAMSYDTPGVAALKRIGIPVLISNPQNSADIFSDLQILGRRTGHTSQAEALVRTLRQRLAAVQAKPRSDVAVFYEIWHEPMLTAGKRSFISSLIEAAGGRNVFADIDLESVRVSVESVLQAKPAVIVIPLEQRNLQERQAFWQHWLGNQVYVVGMNPNILHRPGPRLLDGLEQLQAVLSSNGVAASPQQVK